jgi:DNA-binding LacI/PurR family transcriptional regulator
MTKPGPARRPTLADVAAEAGVSAKTVSNVLLGRDEASSRTRAVVLAAVARLGYEVNPAGRGLASGRSGQVAVVVPNLYQPYFAELAERLILALHQEGLRTMLRVAHTAAAEWEATVGPAVRDVDGVIICPHFLHDGMLDGPLPKPVVQLGGGRSARLDWVAMGERVGSTAMTGHLLGTGRRRIAVVWNSAPGTWPTDERFEGYRAALKAYRVPVPEELIVSGSDWDRRASGYEAMVGLLRTGAAFDAVLGINDAIAVGVLHALRSHGVRVPEDVAVAGFDDTDEGEFTSPALSSVSPEQPEMVAAAVRMLTERIDGYAGPARVVHTGAHLVLRASTEPVEARAPAG